MSYMELFRGEKRLTWQLRLTDHQGLRRQVSTRTEDRSAALSISHKIERLVATRVRGDVLAQDLRSWAAGMHKEIRKKLIEWELLDVRDTGGGARLTNLPAPDPVPPGWVAPPPSLVDQWEQDLQDREVTGAHARQTAQRVRVMLALTVADKPPMVYSEDITGEAVMARIREIRRVGPTPAYAGKKRKAAGPRTCQYYLDRAREFCAWLVSKGILQTNPLAGLVAYTESVMRANRKRQRRPLETSEQVMLVAGVAGMVDRLGISGAERALMYRMVLRTGLRAGELGSLKVKNFNFWNKAITLLAGDVKARREDTLPIAEELVELLKAHFVGKHPEAHAFTKLQPKKYCSMLRADLEELNIPFVDAMGRYADFHSLRHTYGTELAKVVMPAVHKELMRHKDIRTTMAYYTHLVEKDKAIGLAKLPSLAPAPAAAPTGNQAG